MKPKRVSGQGEELEITLCNLRSMTERARARFIITSAILYRLAPNFDAVLKHGQIDVDAYCL